MNESKVVVVAQPIPQDIADKVEREMLRRVLRDRLYEAVNEIKKAGFSLETTYNTIGNNTFTERIVLKVR
ncbi:MAG: hypothetical protein IKZ00_03335 [Bacteroidaceae bacterium]|nr:hypothetical protein [Bacteroidaceae bacterium]